MFNAAPIAAPLLGVDVSPFQSPPYRSDDIDWVRVRKAGIRFAMQKATQGTRYAYRSFKRNFPAALAAAVLTGPYHFLEWQRGMAGGDVQARFFHDWVGELGPGNLFPGCDVEWIKGQRNTAANIAACARDFLEACDELFGMHARSRVDGREAGIYIGNGFWQFCVEPAGEDALALTSWPLWQVDYVGALDPMHRAPEWKPLFWQYTSEGEVDGIEGPVDMNRFFGTVDQLRALAGLGPEGAPS